MNLGFIDRIEPLNTGWLFKKSCDAHILPHGRRTNFAYQRYWEAIGATCNFADAQILWISSLFLPMILSKTVLSGHEFIPRWIFYTRIICQLDDIPRWIFCPSLPFVLKKKMCFSHNPNRKVPCKTWQGDLGGYLVVGNFWTPQACGNLGSSTQQVSFCWSCVSFSYVASHPRNQRESKQLSMPRPVENSVDRWIISNF